MWERVLKNAVENEDVTEISIMAEGMQGFTAPRDEFRATDHYICYSRLDPVNTSAERHTFISYRKIIAIELKKKR